MKSARILVIDDEEDILKTLSMALKLEGYTVESASDGQEGFDKACRLKPDLVVSDVMLPSLNGYQICRKLKDDKEYKDIPIILITVQAQQIYKTQGKQAGANDYLVKPFEMEVLIDKIKNLLK